MSKVILLSAVGLSMFASLIAEEAATEESEIAVVNIEQAVAQENMITDVMGEVAEANDEIAARCAPKNFRCDDITEQIRYTLGISQAVQRRDRNVSNN